MHVVVSVRLVLIHADLSVVILVRSNAEKIVSPDADICALRIVNQVVALTV